MKQKNCSIYGSMQMKNQKRTKTYQEPLMEVVKLSEMEVFTLNVGGNGSDEAGYGQNSAGNGTARMMGGWYDE